MKSLIDKRQRLKKTIIPNPNYFYDGYQLKGDPLHISKKKVRINHLQTFQKINKEFNRKTKTVFNSNRKSKLHSRHIIPYTEIPIHLIKTDDLIKFDWKTVINNILNLVKPKPVPLVDTSKTKPIDKPTPKSIDKPMVDVLKSKPIIDILKPKPKVDVLKPKMISMKVKKVKKAKKMKKYKKIKRLRFTSRYNLRQNLIKQSKRK